MVVKLERTDQQRFAAHALRRQTRALRREIERQGEDGPERGDRIHRTRVASRRLINVLRLFERDLPQRRARRWRRSLRRMLGALGAARDADVQLALIERVLSDIEASDDARRAGIECVREHLSRRRAACERRGERAVVKLLRSETLDELARWVDSVRGDDANEAPPAGEGLRGEARQAIRERLEEMLQHGAAVDHPDEVEELHALRIAAKHLRYTMETFAELFPDRLEPHIEAATRIQTVLGDIHDCDVWAEFLPDLLERAAAEPESGNGDPQRLIPGVEFLQYDRRKRRQELFGQFGLLWASESPRALWREFQDEPLAEPATPPVDVAEEPEPTPAAPPSLAFDPRADARLAGALALAESVRYEAPHAHHVTRMSLELFDALRELHALDDERRFWLTAGALLHDIGWIEGVQQHHKTSLRYILESPLLDWDPRRRLIVGSIARYHRKALPAASHDHYAALSREDQADVSRLAALLRVADALDYGHQQVVDAVEVVPRRRRVVLRVRAHAPAETEAQRARVKGDLFEQVFERELRVKWRLH